jgi:hypothetical protein
MDATCVLKVKNTAGLDREKKIAQFARDYGFQLGFYKPGLCAIFLKQPPRKRPPKVGRA